MSWFRCGTFGSIGSNTSTYVGGASLKKNQSATFSDCNPKACYIIWWHRKTRWWDHSEIYTDDENMISIDHGELKTLYGVSPLSIVGYSFSNDNVLTITSREPGGGDLERWSTFNIAKVE